MDIIQYFIEHPLKPFTEVVSETNVHKKSSCLSPKNPTSINMDTNATDYPNRLEFQEPNVDPKEYLQKSTIKKSIAKMKTTIGNKRVRKTSDQLEILKKALFEAEIIAKENIDELVKKTGLVRIQVYKWFWDHGKKKLKVE